MLRQTVSPIDPGRGEAPSTATLWGSKKGSKEETTASWSRRSTRLAVSLGRSDGKCHLNRATVQMAGDVEARLGEDGEHGDVLGHDFGDEAFDTGLSRQLGQLLEEPCSDPLALKIITHGERDLGRMWVSQSIPAGERDDALLSIRPNRADERSSLTPVGIEKRCREAGTRAHERRESGGSGCARRGLRRTESGRRHLRLRARAI